MASAAGDPYSAVVLLCDIVALTSPYGTHMDWKHTQAHAHVKSDSTLLSVTARDTVGM